MIRSFRDRETERIARGEFSRRFPPAVQKRARLCLERIESVIHPMDLRAFPAVRIKRLKGKRKARYSVRVNDQYRICFAWTGRYAIDVELVDYH